MKINYDKIKQVLELNQEFEKIFKELETLERQGETAQNRLKLSSLKAKYYMLLKRKEELEGRKKK